MEFLSSTEGGEIKPSGGVPRPPVAYGQYETGRSKNPSRKSPFTSPAFKDGMQQSVALERTGDPGAYNPYFYEDSGTNPAFNSSNKNRKPFDSTEVRTLRANLFGIDTPSIGAYPVFEPEKTIGQLDDNLRYPKVDANVSVFRSTSLQRPSAKSAVPSPDHYNPNIKAIHPSDKDMGTGMRPLNYGDRFHHCHLQSNTPEEVGPGSYEQLEKTLDMDSDLALARSSRIRPGFGTTSPQRKLPFYAQGTPAPGTYDPMEPRLKDLSGEARRQVM